MHNVFKSFRPDIVYHAAAYKHVPMMEDNPSEAILTNVRGTSITADLATKFDVKKIIFLVTITKLFCVFTKGKGESEI